MPDKRTVEEKIRELEKKYADEIKKAQSQPGLRDFMKISEGSKLYRKKTADSAR